MDDGRSLSPQSSRQVFIDHKIHKAPDTVSNWIVEAG